MVNPNFVKIQSLEERIKELEKKVKYLVEDKDVDPTTGDWNWK